MNIGIYGYGNLGRGVEDAIKRNPDMKLTAVFTRRNLDSLKIATEKNICVLTTKKALFTCCGILYENGLRGA